MNRAFIYPGTNSLPPYRLSGSTAFRFTKTNPLNKLADEILTMMPVSLDLCLCIVAQPRWRCGTCFFVASALPFPAPAWHAHCLNWTSYCSHGQISGTHMREPLLLAALHWGAAPCPAHIVLEAHTYARDAGWATYIHIYRARVELRYGIDSCRNGCLGRSKVG